MTLPASHPHTGLFDPAALPADAPAGATAPPVPAVGKPGKVKRRRIELLRRSQCVSAELPPGVLLVGDAHVFRGGIFVLGGAPGVGKSRAAVALAVAGAVVPKGAPPVVEINTAGSELVMVMGALAARLAAFRV